MTITKRQFLAGTASTVLLGGTGALLTPGKTEAAPKGKFEVVKSEAEWKRLLTPDQYAVLRKEATERAGSSPLDQEKRRGTFHCAGCDVPVYSSEAKYDSGTGWPSFTASLPGAVGTKEDRKIFVTRTEVHCRRCGGHLGHIFDDGPKPTGMRHCLNGVALKFVPAEAA